MKKTNRAISIILAISILLSTLSGCAKKSTGDSFPASENTNIDITVIDKPASGDKENAMTEATEKEGSSIESLVYSAVDYDLQSKGFETRDCIAFANDYSFTEYGLGYYNPDFQLFAGDDFSSMGFLTVANQEATVKPIPDDCDYIAVEPISEAFDDCNAIYNLLAYSCEDISSGHFIYENKYVVYYQQDSTTVRYVIYENDQSNYDLSLGSLYDFDNDVFVYDESLFDGYETHSAVSLFSEEDYAKLEEELRILSEEQEKNGYIVQELNVVYISPESIEVYIASEEEETFFGYKVSDLEESLGPGTALVYTENGFQEAKYYNTDLEDYNWKSFLTKVGIGCGIILVGAVLAPVTGGVSFSCALLTITKIAVTYALVQSISTLAIGVASGMLGGHSFWESLKGSAFESLDAFANGFMIGAVVGSVGVCSGLIKPTACFIAGTLVAVPASIGIDYVPIEDISVGDYVLSCDPETGVISCNRVIDTIISTSDQIIEITIGNETIITTATHPFYCPDLDGWVNAACLSEGDRVSSIDGFSKTVDHIEKPVIEEESVVYNLTVANDHTYFVSQSGILVHNKCNTLESQRNSAVKKAWKQEVEAVKNGTSKYNWTTKQVQELLKTGKVKGYDGCHIVDVFLKPELAGDPNNIIFLKRYSSYAGEISHFMVHNFNWTNPSNWAEVVKVMPQFTDMIIAVGGAL